MTKKRFPWDCGNCPNLVTYDLLFSGLTYRCVWSKSKISHYERHKSTNCPMEEHDREVKEDELREFLEWLCNKYEVFEPENDEYALYGDMKYHSAEELLDEYEKQKKGESK